MLRRLVVLLIGASLNAAAAAAPMVHRHDDAGHASAHHRGRVIHAHQPAHPQIAHTRGLDGTAVAGADEEHGARAIDLYHMVQGSPAAGAALPSAVFISSPPEIPTLVARLVVQHAHDPPPGSASHLRGPPL